MSRMIGFDRKIQLHWLDMTVGLLQQGLAPDEISLRLNERLEDEVSGPEARRKTIIVLRRIWGNAQEERARLHGEALTLAARVQPGERLWLHWGMSLLAYPFFRDVTATVGRLGRLQEVFSLAQVQRRVVEGWGQRTTLKRALRRVVRTLYEWEVIQEGEGRGQYSLNPPRHTTDEALALWLIECTLSSAGSEQMALNELLRLPCLFPFDVQGFVHAVRRSERFEAGRQGLDLEMVALARR
jgi:hypothetical protein